MVTSYYHQSSKYQLNLTSLNEHLTCDICIIGGGFTGINCALELAKCGFSCLVLESDDLGAGASGHNGGQLIRGLGHDLRKFTKYLGENGVRELELLGLNSPDLVKNNIAKYQIACDLTAGFADLANTPKHFANLQQELANLRELNYPHSLQLVAKQDMAQVVASNNYCGALIDFGSAHLHPLNLLLGEAQAALNLGVQIFTKSKALKISYGAKISVQTAKGKITANNLILACNAYLDGLNSYLDGKILPTGSYIIATEILADEVTAKLIPQNLALCDQKIALDYFRLSPDNRLLFGGACHYSGRDPKDIASYMRRKMLKVLPQLAPYKIDFSWGAKIGIGANRLPQIGRLPNQTNVYYAQGYAGHGINTTHLAAQILAQTICGEQSKIDLFSQVPHFTFPGGKYLRSPLLALGMLWLQLKERL